MMKKHEIGQQTPAHWQTDWPEKFDTFSHFEFAAGIPQVICAITTIKPGGQPNICLHAWNGFQGRGDGYRCYLPGLYRQYHTVEALRHTPEFCVNFLSFEHREALRRTISENHEAADEFAIAGLHREKAAVVAPPRIAEAFLTLECRLEWLGEIGGNPDNLMAVGKVVHAAAAEGYMNGLDKRYGPEGFIFNVHSPADNETGAEALTGMATLKIREMA